MASHTRVNMRAEMYDSVIQLLPAHTHTHICAHCGVLKTSRNTGSSSPQPHTHTGTHRGLMQLLPPHTGASGDLYVQKQSDIVRFVFLHIDTVCNCFVLVQCSYSYGPVFGLWAAMLQGIRMCQMKCCRYLSHNCYESGNTLFLYLM